jgi:type VI secretion system protein ImpL
MTQFCNKLPEKSIRQAMGQLNSHQSRDVIGFLQQALATVEEKLRNLRLRLLGSQQTGAPLPESGPELLLFPLEFGNLKKNLQVFVESAFKENPYQETPLLRGIYFSSGRQEGTPYSHFLSALGLIKHQEVLPGTNRGLFLHDLFATIMAGDRSLYAPTRKALAWHRLTRNIGVTAWAALVLALCGLLSFSFMKNLTTLRTVADTFSQPVALQGEILTDVSIMERFQGGVRHIEAINDSWWFPRLGLKQSLYVEERIKERYCAQFKDEFVTDFDRQLVQQGLELSANSPDEETARYVMHLTRRINLIKSRIEGSGLNRLADMEQPSFQLVLSAADSRLVTQISDRIADQYRHYLAWQGDEQQLNREKSQLQKQLHQVLSLPGANLNWLVAWINQDEGLDGLTLEHFWGPLLEQQDLASVPPAFTMAGKKEVDRLLEQIDQAVPDNLVIAGNKTRFAAWYSQAYRHIWYDFARMFPQAEYYLRDREAWQQAASVMALDKGPYFGLIRRMNEELRGVDESKDDSWIELLRLIGKISLEAKTEKAIEEQKSMIAKVTKKGKSAISTLEKGLGNSGVGQTMEVQLIGGKYFNDYRSGLSDLVLATSSRNVSFQMASDIFSQDPATSEAPMYVAQRNLIRLRNELAIPGAAQDTQLIWRLVAGPLTFLRDYAYLEAACNLNRLWEENVLVEVQGIKDKTELNEVFFSDNGLALKFVKGPAAPFLGRSLEQGFYPRKALGRMLPFRQEFLTFLTEGIRLSRYKPDLRISDEVPLAMKQKSMAPAEPKLKDAYEVLLEASPTSVNREAKMVPHAVSLELTCGAEVTRLLNLQYPVRQKFIWKPGTCQSLSLKIEIGSLLLEKNYEGDYFFARFVKEYQTGAVTYTPLDFPDKEKFLKRLNVRTITVKFKAASGAEPLIRFLDQLEAYNKALGISDKPGAEQEGPNVAEVLMTLESKRKAEELENEAMKKAWKAQQLKRAAEIKQQWEQQLPDVPRDISVCWD